MLEKTLVDAPSYKEQFGWERIGSGDFAVPVIIRSSGVRYSPTRIVEQEIIKKYGALPKSIFLCIRLSSFYLTAVEAKLLNQINFNHCGSRYGEDFFTIKDTILSAADIKELSRFLNISQTIFSQGLTPVLPHFGIIKLVTDPDDQNNTMLVPFLTKVHNNKPVRFIPIRLIENFVTNSQASVKAPLNNWDTMYLQMLCLYCENDLQDFITRDSEIILLDGLLYPKTLTPISFTDCEQIIRREPTATYS